MSDGARTVSLDLAAVKAYWESVASQPQDEAGLRPTARDPFLQRLVESEMEKWIWPGSQLLDIGCGEGTSTLRFAKRAGFVHGIDYVARHIEMARCQAQAQGIDNVEFAQADVMDLAKTRARVLESDVVITIRCLINLASWDNQVAALRQIAAAVKPGGLYLLSEGWSDGWDGLNRARQRCGLGPIELVKYNLLIDRTRFEQVVCGDFEVVDYRNLGFYIFMSRVFQPAFVAPAAPQHLHDINRVAAQLAGVGIGALEFEAVDYAGVYVLRRK